MQHRTYLTALAAILAVAITTEANATGDHQWTPKPPTPPVASPRPTPATQPVYVGGSPSSSAGATAGSSATATSGSTAGAAASTGPVLAGGGTSSAAGGTGGTASTGDSGATGGTSGSSLTSVGGDTRAIGLSFAPGASTPPMPAPGGNCAATITQSSFNVGMGLFSAAKASTDPRICHLIEQRNRFERMCLFASMKQVDDLLTAELLPGFKVPAEMYAISTQDPGYVDMTPDKCAARRPPIVVVAPPAPPPPAQPAPPAPKAPEKVSLSSDALFDFDKATLKPAGKAKLDELATKLQGEAANVVITGHTDSRGTAAYNDRLSMQRANAVRAHLMLAGIDGMRMVALGKGKREPSCTEATEDCHAQNRRVDVQILVQAPSPKLAALVR
jgi:outer membrane protein OmpA-like peptidoglycan-associated protein